MEIISSLNQKINKHIETTKFELSNVGPGGGGAPKPAGGNGYEGNSRVLHLETELEKLRIEVQTQANNERLRQEEMENFFKKASLEYFTKLKDTSDRLDSVKQSANGNSNISNLVHILEQEVIDLKNQMKTRSMRTNLGGDAAGIDPGVEGKLDLLIEEIN